VSDPGARPRPRVLLLDDDDVNLMTMELLLDERGYAVRIAHTLAEALALSASERFDLVVFDVHVGDELSPSIVPRIRAAQPGVGVVFLSGSLGHREQIPGADLLLAKAEDPERVLDEIDRVARARRA
jgi:two-component system response regulator RegA